MHIKDAEIMALSNLRKSIFYLQQALRHDYEDDADLLKALNIMSKRTLKNIEENYNMDGI